MTNDQFIIERKRPQIMSLTLLFACKLVNKYLRMLAVYVTTVNIYEILSLAYKGNRNITTGIM